jgi:hypothetical protein
MPNLKISQLTAGNPAATGDQIPINRSGANYYITADSIAALATGATLGLTAPFWWMMWEGSNFSFSNSGNGQYGTNTANQVKVAMIRIPYQIKVKQMTTRILSSSASAVGGCGIYDSSGNRLIHWDNYSLATGGVTVTVQASGSLTLQPGLYYGATACSDTSSAASLGGFGASGTNEGVQPWNTNGTTRVGYAANAMAAGVLPATLGALSPGGGGLNPGFPNILLEP